MTIAEGDRIPDVQVMTTVGGNPTHVQTSDVLGSGKVVLFAVPGAFTPTCSDYHLPSYVIRHDELVAKGVDTVACISVNDPFVMSAWGDSQNVGDSVLLLADGNGEFASAVGLEMDGSGFGLGTRSQRYAMVIEDGVVTALAVEPGAGLTVSAADAILEILQARTVVDLSEALRSTGAVREFTGAPVDDATVYRLLDTARFAPNGGNRQAWRVVVVQDPATRRTLRDLYLPGWYDYLAQVSAGLTPWAVVTDRELEAASLAAAADIAASSAAGPGGFAEHLDEVPVMLVLLADLSRLATVDRDADHYTMVGGASIYPFAWSILLAARSEGLAGVLTTMVVREERAVADLLGVPDTHLVAGLMALGHPVHQPTRLRRGSVEEFATLDRFDGPGAGAPVKVRIGVGMGPLAGDPSGLGELVDDLDELGFDSLWLPEVLTAPTLDPLVALAFAAAHNPRLKLGTTMLLPGRNVVRLAKQLATLDRLSGGRLLITFVPGLPRPPESVAVGVSGGEKGARMDESFPVLRRLWAGETVDHHGTVGEFDGVTLEPLPLQDPLEFWLGGMVPAALERCGRFADGWLPSACTPEEAAAGRIVIDEAAEAAGRAISREHFGVSLAYAPGPLDPSLLAALGRSRRGVDPATVVPAGLDALRDCLESFLAVGFSKFVVRPLARPDSWRAELEALAVAVGDLQT